MPGLMQNVIVSAAADPGTPTARLGWQNGSVTQADFARLAEHGMCAAFTDPTFFEQATVLDDGQVLAWPGDLEFDADAMWFEAHPEDSPSDAAIKGIVV